MRHLPIAPSVFKNNRERFIKLLPKNAVAIFHSNDQMPRNGDQYFPFRQQSDFFYLTGIDQEKSILLLAPDCPNKNLREVLFTIETNEKIAISNAKAEILKRESGSTPFIGKRELEYFLDRYLNRQTINIFVPAFLSRNPYAYIKVGRLMTSHQIKFKATSSRGISQVLCALSEEMAEKLLDFIFISTLPEKIKLAGHFLENLHLELEGRASLVEFPFIPRGNYLISVLGGFSVSRKLIMLPSDMALIG